MGKDREKVSQDELTDAYGSVKSSSLKHELTSSESIKNVKS